MHAPTLEEMLADDRDDEEDRLIDEMMTRPFVPSQYQKDWHVLFFYNMYDWDAPSFANTNKGPGSWAHFKSRRLGYYMIVSEEDRELITRFPDGKPKRWYAKRQEDALGRIERVYFARHGKKIYGEPKEVYAHREIVGCIGEKGGGLVVDHMNGYGLDNRRENLKVVGYAENGANSSRIRTKNPGLPTGVERITKGPHVGKYRGMSSKRLSKSGRGSVKTVRSKEYWDNPDEAAAWYQATRSKNFEGRTEWVHTNPTSITYPVFPPRLNADDEIPF